jgi:ABC-2 type transport system permease protein
VNLDAGVISDKGLINYGRNAIDFFNQNRGDTLDIPFKIKEIKNKDIAAHLLKEKKADALVIIPSDFSRKLALRKEGDSSCSIPIEISGDLSSTNYLITAVWGNELFSEFLYSATNTSRLMKVKETALGSSGNLDDFDMIVPGILILSLIMLMFTASIAFVSEVENKTIMRLKLSGVTAFEFLGGISIVQTLIGMLSVVLTLLTALALGFNYTGSLLIMLLIAGLTSISIISFSLIIAALTKSANEVLIAGNFPMFLFMFFTGAAFPMKPAAVFNIAGYPVSIQGLMTPVHAISALNKTLVMNMRFSSIIPELLAILLLTILYFLIGAVIFSRRHLKVG